MSILTSPDSMSEASKVDKPNSLHYRKNHSSPEDSSCQFSSEPKSSSSAPSKCTNPNHIHTAPPSLFRPMSPIPVLPPDSPKLCPSESCSSLAYSLLEFAHIPTWLQDNPHIKAGYRCDIGWKNSCHSICVLHNETVNIWTHLIASTVMIILLVFTMWSISPHGIDRLNLDIITQSNMIKQFYQPHPPTCPLNQPHGPEEEFGSLSVNNQYGNCSVEDPHLNAYQNFLQTLDNLLHTDPSDYLPQQVLDNLNHLHSRLPDVVLLTSSLKNQALQLGSSLSLPNVNTTTTKFLAFLQRIDEQVNSLSSSLSQTLSKSQQLGKGAIEHLQQFKAQLESNVGSFVKHLTTGKHVDMVRVVKSMMSEFVHSLQNGDDDNNSVNEDENEDVGLMVRVRRLAGLGDGSVFFSVNNQNDHFHYNHFQADSKTNSINNIHTSTPAYDDYLNMSVPASRIVEEELQLHFFLPRWPLSVFLLSACLCLLFSTFFHSFQAVSQEMAGFFQNLDYAGICLLIAGSNYPVIYYGFYCSPYTALFYLIVITSLGGTGFIVTILPRFRSLKYREMKLVLFVAMGLFGVIPLVHLLISFGFIHWIAYYLIVMGAFYLSGALVYLLQVPERWYPGIFDYFFSSHQIWHLCIIGAVLTHYLGVMHFYEWRMTKVCLH